VLQPVEIVHSLARSCGRREYRLGVALQELQPADEVLRVVGTHILRDAKLGAQKGGADLGDEFFRRDLRLAETLGEVAVKARRVACVVRFMPISA
jgi:hypothetical protein